MGTSKERAKERRVFRLEHLEDRSLLSVARPAIAAEVISAAAAATPITVLTGHIQGVSASNGLMTGTVPGHISYSGTGQARQLGFVYLGSEHIETQGATTGKTTPFTVSGGSGVLSDIKANKITFAYVGSGTSIVHGQKTVTLNGFVTSGTGRFDGVTGSFSATGTFHGALHHFNLSFSVVLKYPTLA
jgi:hypothetical protein